MPTLEAAVRAALAEISDPTPGVRKVLKKVKAIGGLDADTRAVRETLQRLRAGEDAKPEIAAPPPEESPTVDRRPPPKISYPRLRPWIMSSPVLEAEQDRLKAMRAAGEIEGLSFVRKWWRGFLPRCRVASGQILDQNGLDLGLAWSPIIGVVEPGHPILASAPLMMTDSDEFSPFTHCTGKWGTAVPSNLADPGTAVFRFGSTSVVEEHDQCNDVALVNSPMNAASFIKALECDTMDSVFLATRACAKAESDRANVEFEYHVSKTSGVVYAYAVTTKRIARGAPIMVCYGLAYWLSYAFWSEHTSTLAKLRAMVLMLTLDTALLPPEPPEGERDALIALPQPDDADDIRFGTWSSRPGASKVIATRCPERDAQLLRGLKHAVKIIGNGRIPAGPARQFLDPYVQSHTKLADASLSLETDFAAAETVEERLRTIDRALA